MSLKIGNKDKIHLLRLHQTDIAFSDSDIVCHILLWDYEPTLTVNNICIQQSTLRNNLCQRRYTQGMVDPR